MIFTIGIFTSLFFFILLLNKKNKSLPDGILSIWMLVISIHLTSYYIYSEGYWDIYPHLIGVTVPFPFFYGPLLYLYVDYSIKDDHRLRKQDYLHFLPIVLTYLYMCRFYFFYSAEEKRLVDKGLIDDFGTFSNILVVAIIVSAITYAIFSYRLLNKYKRLIENNFSNTERINLNWLRSFIWGVALIFFTVIIVLVSRDVIGITYPFNADFIFYSMIVFAILSLGYFGIRHENIFTDNVVIEIEEKSETGSRVKYQKSSLREDQAQEYYQKLISHMKVEKPFLESKFTLPQLADQLELNPNYISQVINEKLNQNFYDFINKYRIEEFKRRLKTKTASNYTLLAHGLESGFSSKSSFNEVFKKFTGQTPSEYNRELAS